MHIQAFCWQRLKIDTFEGLSLPWLFQQTLYLSKRQFLVADDDYNNSESKK